MATGLFLCEAKDAIPEVRQLLSSEKAEVRRFSAYVLAGLGDDGGSHLLTEMAADDNLYWKRLGEEALEALGE